MPETVALLVVEDQYLLHEPLDDAFTEAGFGAEFVGSGEEAAVLLEGAPEKYKALLTDINLAGRTNGWEIAKLSRRLNPEFPVVYMTGSNGAEWASEGVPNSILVQKPFAPAQAVVAVSQLLNKGT